MHSMVAVVLRVYQKMCTQLDVHMKKVSEHLLYPSILQDVIIALTLISSMSPTDLFEKWNESGLTVYDKRSHYFFTQYLKHHASPNNISEEREEDQIEKVETAQIEQQGDLSSTVPSGEGVEKSLHYSPYKGARWTQFIHILMDLYLANIANSIDYSIQAGCIIWLPRVESS